MGFLQNSLGLVFFKWGGLAARNGFVFKVPCTCSRESLPTSFALLWEGQKPFQSYRRGELGCLKQEGTSVPKVIPALEKSFIFA